MWVPKKPVDNTSFLKVAERILIRISEVRPSLMDHLDHLLFPFPKLTENCIKDLIFRN